MEEQQTIAMTDAESPTVKRRLGRGLNALLGSAPEAAELPSPTVKLHSPEQDELSAELIETNPFQPRREFDQKAIDELAESIRKHGVLQPLLVRAVGDGYQLIAGERRWRATKQVGLETIPCRVVELEDKAVCEAAIEENLERQDLNVLEKAKAFQDYLDRFKCSIEDLAKQLSMSRSNVSNMLRLLELPDAVKAFVAKNTISAGHARAILPVDEAKQLELCHKIQRESLSVRAVESAVREHLAEDESGTSKASAKEKSAKPELSNHLKSLQDHLREQLGAKVEIKVSSKSAGKVIVHFGSNDEFEQLVGKLRKAA